MSTAPEAIRAVPVPASLLGESPVWHPLEQRLYWCDIPGHALHCHDPATGSHQRWDFDTDVACCAPVAQGGLLLALRSGLLHFDPASGRRTLLAAAPYPTATERFNDGKTDPQGRFWVGTIHEPRDAARASLYRFGPDGLRRMGGEVTTSNGLAWSPDGRTLYWSDTKDHVIYALDHDPVADALPQRRVFARFPDKPADGSSLAGYGGRPDGAAVDAEGGYWVAMFEGARVLRLSPQGRVLREVPLPVRCPTMPCFGGPDLKTLYITTARHHRPTDELAREPLAGCVLQLRVEVAGLPATLVRL